MARNRKRRNDQRPRRSSDAPASQPGVATARGERREETPDPIEHATPDVELAEAQLAVGRPDQPDGEAAAEEAEESTELAPSRSAAPVHRARGIARLVQFLQGSWRELQRVQWPDRRQVMQATGVVIGFVIVAGLFLGAADFVAGKFVNLILK
ncbi:MAG: preprotein translocase subunit SecE [Solirubrobacteraceae bacterium]